MLSRKARLGLSLFFLVIALASICLFATAGVSLLISTYRSEGPIPEGFFGYLFTMAPALMVGLASARIGRMILESGRREKSDAV